MKISYNEFHISRKVREECNFEDSLFSSAGNVVFANFKAVHKFQTKLNELFDKRGQSEKKSFRGLFDPNGLNRENFPLGLNIF